MTMISVLGGGVIGLTVAHELVSRGHAGQALLSRAAGLRPGRVTVRLERVPGHGRTVIACDGRGGAGFTLFWGEVADVAALL